MENQHQKITGYRDLSQEEIDLMNKCKKLGEEVGNLAGNIMLLPETDQRWAAIAVADLQKGFMALIRSIAKPTTF